MQFLLTKTLLLKMQPTVTLTTCLGSLGIVAINRNNRIICCFDTQVAKACTALATVDDDKTVR
jgi:hypothetical protein